MNKYNTGQYQDNFKYELSKKFEEENILIMRRLVIHKIRDCKKKDRQKLYFIKRVPNNIELSDILIDLESKTSFLLFHLTNHVDLSSILKKFTSIQQRIVEKKIFDLIYKNK
ncbi:unnamed protein product [Paramecium sonneborni]|uniref:Uncharacterized protein n=1 Tax=Paramecium sonneborni TaxID=65129 RepID=A0A8S1JXI8_9CILI|nr:unnamed protein product [Paramecium sonneborni]CAD8047253.1 unnamed protein product [Paramecium sonneborni]